MRIESVCASMIFVEYWYARVGVSPKYANDLEIE